MLASKHISNTMVLVIHEVDDIDDKVQVQFVGTEAVQRKTWHKIRYNIKGESYFIKHNTRHYISDFTKS